MAYPRNAASPERIAVGTVVQISDGAVQSSGVTITVRGQGGAEGTGGGTTAYGASGVVYYTPTQAETDFASFVVIASKTGCIPVSQTVITSASTVPGYYGIDWSKINAPTTAVNLSGTNIDTDQVVASVTGAVGSVTGAVGSVTGAVGSVTGNVGGNVSGSVGSIATGGISEASFATTAGSFAPLGIVDQGTAQAATSTTLQLRSAAAFANDELIGSTIVITGGSTGVGQAREITDYVSSTDTATVDTWTTTPSGTITYKIFAGPPSSTAALAAVADAVWDEATSGHTTAGTTGKALTDASSAGDPWSTALPGAYSSGTAGHIIGNNLNATVGSRATQTSVDTIDDLIDTEVAAIKTVVDAIEVDTQDIQSRLPAALVGGRMDSNASAISGDSVAADNLEAALDGTGGVTITAAVTGNITGNLSGSVGSVTGSVGSVTGNVGGNVTGSVGSVAAGGITASSLAADTITAAKVAADVTTELQSGLATASALTSVASDVTAVKAKTDSLTFTQAGHVDANVQRINDVAITGDGQPGTEFGVT